MALGYQTKTNRIHAFIQKILLKTRVLITTVYREGLSGERRIACFVMPHYSLSVTKIIMKRKK